MAEVVGIIATLVALLSFLRKEPLRIRTVNLIGVVLFATYGLWIGATSAWLLNGALVFI